MNVSQVLLSDCLNLSMRFLLSALSSSTVKAQMPQRGHLEDRALLSQPPPQAA